MSLKGNISEDLNSAMKEKKEAEVLALRQVSAAILNKEKEKRFKLSKENPEDIEKESQLNDEEIIEVISSEAKKRREAIEGFERGQRAELAEKEKQELVILQRYLPEQLSEEEIQKLAKESIERVGAKEVKDMGKVMAELAPQVKGKADGSQVSKIVKELLGA